MSLIALVAIGLLSASSISGQPVRSALKIIEDIFADRCPPSYVPHSASAIGRNAITQLYRYQARSLLQSPHNAPLFFVDASKYGFPSVAGTLIFCNKYIVSCDRRMGQPLWVLEHSSEEMVGRHGYDRSQLPSSNKDVNHRLKDHSVCSSNVTPQLPALNAGPWMVLESYIEHLARHSKNIYIITGTLYWLSVEAKDNQRLSFVSNEIARAGSLRSPTHFYKVCVYENTMGQLSMEAFVLPNSEENNGHSDLNEFRIDIDRDLSKVEVSSGMPLFHKLSRDQIRKPDSLQFGFDGNLEGDSPDGSIASSSSFDSIELPIG